MSYLSLLRHTNGGEGPLATQPFWIWLYSAEEVAEAHQAGRFREYFSGLFVIGSNGAGEAIALDLRGDAPFPVVFFDMINIDLSESIRRIADSFDDALEMIGHEVM